jgi:polar amino acid transport system substrate-binding protein
MNVSHWFLAVMFGFLFSSCTTTERAAVPTGRDVQQAIAPTGQLRVAFISGPLYASKIPATEALKGVAVDLGEELARRTGVPFVPVLYPSPAAILAAAPSGEWDVALMGINAERAASADFSPAYMEVQQGYLVRPGVAINSAVEVDRDGVRVAAAERTGADLLLTRTLKRATLVRAKTVGELDALLAAGKADVVAATKTLLYDTAAKHPGSRVLPENLLVEPIGIAVPKGRDAKAAAHVRKFVEEARTTGLVQSSIKAAGLRGVNAVTAK